MVDHSKNLESNAFKPLRFSDFWQKSDDFLSEIVLEAVWEPNLAPRGAQIGFTGGWGTRTKPQGGEEKRQEGAKMAQEGPKEAHLEALGANVG